MQSFLPQDNEIVKIEESKSTNNDTPTQKKAI